MRAMGSWDRSVRLSVFLKIVIGFMLVTIPLLVFSQLAIRAGMDAAGDRAEDSSTVQMNLFMKILDDELTNIGQMLIALNNDPDLPAYYLQQHENFTFQNVSLYQNLKSKMGLIAYANNYIADVYLVDPELNKVVSFRDGVREIDARKQQMMEAASRSETMYNRYLDRDYLSYTTQFSGLGDDPLSISYYLGVDIYKERIVDALKSLEEDNVFQVFLVEAGSNRLIEGSSRPERDRDIYASMGHAIHASAHPSRVSFGGDHYVVYNRTTTDHLFSIVAYADEQELLKPMHQLRQWSTYLWIATGIVVLLFAFFIYKQIHSPLGKLVASMKGVEQGDYSARILLEQGDEFGYVYKQFNRMVHQIQVLVEEVLQKKMELQEAHLKMLQSQINPHFLYNSLYQGYRMAKSGETEHVASLCKYLGDYFRFVTRNAMTEHVRLADELRFTETYLEIQKLRFSDRLHSRITVEDGLEELLVPVLMLQPLVENAILHGFEDYSSFSQIDIDIARTLHDSVVVTVRDNGGGMSAERLQEVKKLLEAPILDQEHCGMWNVHQRLLRSFAGSSGLIIVSDDSGTEITFSIDDKIATAGITPSEEMREHVQAVDCG
ncbi:sensor histidine kinase [Paenibacillus daejeonensis]|uniref:sensor histidine kinase n=1 Tax=Paenibacillus daejeonensis TaxID=135193 RepID=UPI00037DD147|nr:sensor histidine kinase [Paenibacillus daejeonensis]